MLGGRGSTGVFAASLPSSVVVASYKQSHLAMVIFLSELRWQPSYLPNLILSKVPFPHLDLVHNNLYLQLQLSISPAYD